MSLRDLLDRLVSGAVPPGFDPSTPESAVRTGPGVGQSLDIAQNEGRLAGIANLAKLTQMGRGGMGDPVVSAKSVLSKYRPKWSSGEPGPTIREWLKGQPGRTESPQAASERLDFADDITIPYRAGGEGLNEVLQPGAGSFSARLSPTREFQRNPSQAPERKSVLHNLYQQLLEANIFGQTHN
jgi:hypothetical protein